MDNNKKQNNFMVGLGYSLTQPNYWVCNNNKQLFGITDNFPTITIYQKWDNDNGYEEGCGKFVRTYEVV